MTVTSVLLAIVILISLFLAILSYRTRINHLKPVGERYLLPCPDKPNCVSSKSTIKQHSIEVFQLLQNDPLKSRDKLIQAIKNSGGKILLEDDRYIHAVYTSSLFRFKDDLEAEISETHIDIRSASRAGTSDLGVNRKRVEKIRSLYQ